MGRVTHIGNHQRVRLGLREDGGASASVFVTGTSDGKAHTVTTHITPGHAPVVIQNASGGRHPSIVRTNPSTGSSHAYYVPSSSASGPAVPLMPPRRAPFTPSPSLVSLVPGLSSVLGSLGHAAPGVPAVPTPLVVPPALERKTVGSPSLEEILAAVREGRFRGGSAPAFAKFDPATGQAAVTSGGGIGVTQAGKITTPAVRAALQGLSGAKQQLLRGATPNLSGLSPAERRIFPYAQRAHRAYPDIPISVLMAQDKQESGFNPLAESSAGAFGTSQFIPSTASSYGVQRGATPRAIQSQLSGQAHLLHDQGFATDPQSALSAYSGGYAAGDYNNPILADARASYSALDRGAHVPPPLRADYGHAARRARTLGIAAPTQRQALAGGLQGAGKVANPPYVYPFPKGAWEEERIDQGQDFGPRREGAPILAIGRGKVLSTGAPGWPGGEGGVLYKLLRGPKKGHNVFSYESLSPTVQPGDVVHPGEIIGRGITGGTGVESGWADTAGVPLSHAEYSEGMETRAGKAFAGFLSNLAAGRPVGPGVVVGGGGIGGVGAVPGVPVAQTAQQAAALHQHPAIALSQLASPLSAGPVFPEGSAPAEAGEDPVAQLLAALTQGPSVGRRRV